MASSRLPRSITRRISKLAFYMQKIQKPDAVLTSGFWHFTRRGEKLGIRNEKLEIRNSEWDGGKKFVARVEPAVIPHRQGS